ncbi:MAG: hypothetical protein JAZ17_00230 [Candidatus Thiodiazotropha endolucinida]|nr:hypothetical protein [Candidatus Thiodiazotropha taylori]MCG8092052.1 hypothetical protein [Candidatus Thiodiazotropha endolucinida]MCW4315625.1 hypothetical protein [Candidatus Thiodiazotropha taylori]
MYMVWIIFFVISITAGIAWILFGPGDKLVRFAVGGSLAGGIILLWILALSGLFTDKTAYIMTLVALVFGIVLLFLPIAHKTVMK